MAEETVTIGVDIDIAKAEQRLKDIKQRISELTEEFGSAGPEVLSNILKPLNEEYEQLSEQLKQVKEDSESANESFKNQTKGLNDLKDVTDFAGDATKKLGLDETALGSAISGTTGFIGKSIVFLKNGAKAMDAMKTSTNNATGSVNKFKTALNGIAKHPILIVLAAIAAAAAALYSRVKSLEDAKFDRYLGLINRQAELLNEKLNNQITILNAIGVKQSTVTRQQINNLKDLNNQLKLSKDRYADLWEAQGNERITITAYAQQYLEGDMQYISKMSDKEQELVKRFAEAGEEMRKNNVELKTMENIILKINLAEEKNEFIQRRISNEQDKINNNLNKQLNILNRRKKVQESNISSLRLEKEYSTELFDAEKDLFDTEQESIDTQIKANNELINKLNERKDAYNTLKGEIMNAGKSVAETDLELSNIDDNLHSIEQEIKTIEETNKNLAFEKVLNVTNRNLDYTQRRLESISKLNQLNLEYAERQLKLENTRAFKSNFFDKSTWEKALGGVSEDYPLVDYFNKINDVYNSTGEILDNFVTRLSKNSDVYNAKADGIVNKLKEAIKNVREELNNVGTESPEVINEIESRLKTLTDAYEEYMQMSSNLLNTLEGVQLEVFNVTKDRIGGAIDVFSSIVPVDDMKVANEVMDNYTKQLYTLRDQYMEVYSALLLFKDGRDEYTSWMTTWSDWQKNIFDQFKDYNGTGLTVVYEMLEGLNKSAIEYEAEAKRLIMINSQMKASFMEDYASLGQIISGDGSIQQLTLKNLYNAQMAAIDAEKEYMDELLKTNGEYYEKLLAAGMSVVQIDSVLAEKRLQVETELINKKALLNQQYNQTIVNATADTMSDIQSIMDVAFEDNKELRGATLMVTTLADAAATYTSVFAQAPGGAAAKAIQAGIASAAVIARGISSYNSLMNMTKDSGTESLSSATATNTIPTTTGVDSTSIARTLIGSRYAGEGHTTQYVLVTDEVTAKQKQAQGARRLETI